MNPATDHILFERIKKSDEKAFEALFRAYYPYLCHYCIRFVKDDSVAEEIVQELFVKLWEKRKETHIGSSIKSYLFRAAKNHCINHLRHLKIKDDYSKSVRSEAVRTAEEDYDSQDELMAKIEESIAALPEKRREIFRLSRQEGLKYREIADRLNVSIKTVETQMGLAIKTLREKLRDFLPLF